MGLSPLLGEGGGEVSTVFSFGSRLEGEESNIKYANYIAKSDNYEGGEAGMVTRVVDPIIIQSVPYRENMQIPI